MIQLLEFARDNELDVVIEYREKDSKKGLWKVYFDCADILILENIRVGEFGTGKTLVEAMEEYVHCIRDEILLVSDEKGFKKQVIVPRNLTA